MISLVVKHLLRGFAQLAEVQTSQDDSNVGAVKTYIRSGPIMMTSSFPFSASSSLGSVGRAELSLVEVKVIVANSEGVFSTKWDGLVG